jgi:hypothetical protein
MIGGLSKAIIVEQIITLNKNKPRVIKTILSPNGISFDGDQSPLFPDSVFLPSEISPSIMHDEVQRYDVINKLNLTEEFDNYLRKIEPRLKRTSLSIYNGMTVIHADVGFGLVPLSILGSGSYKLANIYLSFIYARNGVVLIDEIENSFHYSMLDTIWSSIAELSQKFNIQVFAVTHSNECLKSAFVTLKEKNIKDFSIHRLDRKEGIIKMHKFEEKQLESLISAEWDLR